MKQFPMKGQIMEQNNLSDGKPGVLSVPPPRFHAHNYQARWPASGSFNLEAAGNEGETLPHPSNRVGNLVPEWQLERMEIVLRACQSLAFYVERRRGVWRSARRVARRYHQRALKSDPARIVHLSPGTLVHFYYKWKAAGKVTTALRLNYAPGNRGVSKAVMIRFVLFASTRPWRSLRAAWRSFCQQPGKNGPGKAGLRYDPMRRNLPKGFFEALKREQAIAERAKKQIAALRAGAVAEIRRRPSLPPRPTQKGGTSII